MKKILLALATVAVVGQVQAGCNSAKALKGTWRYYQAAAYAVAKSNISRCEAAFQPTDKLTGSFEGYCWISPGKGPKTVNMFGSYAITNPKTCDVEMLMDMGAMGVSTFNFVLAADHQTWNGQWTSKAGDWGVTNATRILGSVVTPVPPAE